MLNAIGLANPGRERVPRRDAAAPARARPAALGLGRRLLGPRLRRDLRAARPRRHGLELNLSCPNVDEAPETAAEIVAACRAATDLPLYAKLSPAAWDIAEIARAVEAAGADGLSLVNTIRGLALDGRLRPRLARATGGYSGPALKPIALAAVYACRRATALPIVGMGGVAPAATRSSCVACGATHVALGTVLFADPEAPATGAGGARRGARGSRFRAGRERLLRGPRQRCHARQRAERCRLHVAPRLLVCGAHGAADIAGSSSGSVSRPADGGTQAGERHPRQARPAEEGPEVRRTSRSRRSSATRPSTSRPRRSSTC